MAAVLKSLSFTTVPQTAGDPVLHRRVRLVSLLEEQRALVQDPGFARVVRRWATVDGQKQQVEKKVQVRPWWRTDADGRIVMSVKYGTKPVEFEKGKAGIAVPSKDKLTTVIDTLIAAVRSGELDELLAKTSEQRKVPGKPKRAA